MHSVALLGPSPLQISRFLGPIGAGAVVPCSNRSRCRHRAGWCLAVVAMRVLANLSELEGMLIDNVLEHVQADVGVLDMQLVGCA